MAPIPKTKKVRPNDDPGFLGQRLDFLSLYFCCLRVQTFSENDSKSCCGCVIGSTGILLRMLAGRGGDVDQRQVPFFNQEAAKN